jgi:iron complex transport system substrate-binding protein
MRIVSLVPSATEMLFALGLGGDVVGVTHECDYPPQAQQLPKITRDTLAPGLTAAEIDAAVKSRSLAGESIYDLDADMLHALAPELIVTQALCEVCAVSYDDVRAIAETIETRPVLLSLDPHTVGEMLGDFRTIAQATDTQDEAVELIRRSSARIDQIRALTREAGTRPRVVALEWLDPPFTGGHWTPQLIDFAGGEDVLGLAGEHSEQTSWELVAATKPDIVIVMPCGYGAVIAHREAEMHREQLASLGAERIVAVNAGAFYSRPGPRLIDGLELLAHIIHPELVGEPMDPSARAIPVTFS